jgi:hypothetical protein
VDVLKKKFEDEERKKKAMDTFNTPKSKILGGLERKKPARVLVSPLGATLVLKNSTQQSIDQYVTDSNKKKKPKNKSQDLLHAYLEKQEGPPGGSTGQEHSFSQDGLGMTATCS